MTGKEAAPNPRRSRPMSRLFAAALFIAAAFLVIRSLAPQTLGETARRKFLSQLRDHYTGLSVTIGRGRFDPDVGIIFEDLRIAEPASSAFQFRAQELVRVERMTIVANLHPEKLLEKKIPMTTRRVVLEGVEANVWLDAEGKASLDKLLPMPNLGPAAPVMQIRNAKVRLIGGDPQLRPVDIEIASGLIETKTDAAGSVERKITLRGRSDFANNFVVQCDMIAGSTDLRATIKNAHLDRDLFERLPSQWSDQLREARDLDCVCDTSLSLFQSADGKRNYRLRTTLHEGRFSHPELPKPITHLRGVIACDPTGITIEASQGMIGDAVFRVSGKVDGFGWPAPANLHVTARGLLLDDQLASAIPVSMRTNWDRLRPYGRIDVDADMVHADEKWTCDATVMCKGVDVRYDKFPYPVTQLVGRVDIRAGIAVSKQLDGRLGGTRMQCAFRLPIKKGVTKKKTFVMETDSPIAIDSTLVSSLSPRGSPTTKLEAFVRSLSPRGSIHLVSAVIGTSEDGIPTRRMNVKIVDGHLRYEKFAYPLYNVDGTFEVEDDLVKLVGFRATNANAGLILCDGGYQMPSVSASPNSTPVPAAPGTALATIESITDSHLALHFRASNVPMDNSLRSSIPKSTQNVWDAISPSGVLDELKVMITQHGSRGDLNFDITAKQNPTDQVTSRSLSLRPVSFPYRLDVTGGSVRFDGSQVIIDSIKARHDASIVSADGGCVQKQDGRWELLLNLHSGSRVNPDAELIAATPAQMREAMKSLQLRGPVGLRGQSRLLMSDDRHPEPVIDWNLVLQLEGNRIADVGPVHSMRGEVSVEGSRDELGLRASGDVRIDSMHVNDLQLTSIVGPFVIDGDQLTLGGGAIDRTRRPTLLDLAKIDSSASIRGELFGGTLRLDGEVLLSRASFDVDLAVSDAEVPTILAEFGYANSDLTGTFTGKTQLEGTLGTTELLKGGGAARVTGANLYQLPLIVTVLNQLRIKPTEAVAFTDGEVDFTLFGDSVTFSEMQLWGDLVALHGGGTLDRRRELDLTFNTRVSPQNTFTQIFRPLKSQKYTLWTIDVKGPIESPIIERRSLEAVGETFERLFPGVTTTEQPGSGPANWFR